MIYGVEDEFTFVGPYTIRTVRSPQKIYGPVAPWRKTIDITYRVPAHNSVVTLSMRKPKTILATTPVRPTLTRKTSKSISVSQGGIVTVIHSP
jgi:hypothetical protein